MIISPFSQYHGTKNVIKNVLIHLSKFCAIKMINLDLDLWNKKKPHLDYLKTVEEDRFWSWNNCIRVNVP